MIHSPITTLLYTALLLLSVAILLPLPGSSIFYAWLTALSGLAIHWLYNNRRNYPGITLLGLTTLLPLTAFMLPLPFPAGLPPVWKLIWTLGIWGILFSGGLLLVTHTTPPRKGEADHHKQPQ